MRVNETEIKISPREILDAVDRLARAVRSISHGGVDGPLGLELLSMTISGVGAYEKDTLCKALREGMDSIAVSIGDGLGEIAAALRELKKDEE